MVCKHLSDDDLSNVALTNSRLKATAHRLFGQEAVVREDQDGKVHKFRRGDKRTPVTDLTVISSLLRSHLCRCETCHGEDNVPASDDIDNTPLSDILVSFGDTVRTSLLDYRIRSWGSLDAGTATRYSSSVKCCQNLCMLTNDGSTLVERDENGTLLHFTIYPSTNDTSGGEEPKTAVPASGSSKKVIVGRKTSIESSKDQEVVLSLIADLLLEGRPQNDDIGVSVVVVNPLLCFWNRRWSKEEEELAKTTIVADVRKYYTSLAGKRDKDRLEAETSIEEYVKENTSFLPQGKPFSDTSSACRLQDHLEAYPDLMNLETETGLESSE